MIDEAKNYVLWYAERIYENGMVPPILNPDGSANRGYGSDIEFDAQGEFVAIAADIHRISPDRKLPNNIFEPVLRATGFDRKELCARTNAVHGPKPDFMASWRHPSAIEGYNKPTYSYWDDYFALTAWRNCAYLAAEIGDEEIATWAKVKGQEFAANLARSLRMTSAARGLRLVPASADREDVDPTSTSIVFEPCRSRRRASRRMRRTDLRPL
ncbi:MAG: hypothetical protein MZV65_14855 [Chromatiales bacterium]|nr:hypothetical protein [Chromatiales bacterium]